MIGKTHLLIGLSASLLAGKFLMINDPALMISFCTVGTLTALAPDIDHPGSTIRKYIWFPGQILGHRTFFHSLWIPLALALCWYIAGGHILWLASAIGYGSHILADSLNPSGIRLIYPLGFKFRVLPGFLAIQTGSVLDHLLGWLSIAGSLLLIMRLSGWW